ncbi:hypothetical protein M0E87_07825 [Corynebacterium sp. CCM 9185]|uniref:DUF222 domain-containing protein n=1 Tax=Corynebacterium marambiense TaxID=2765364 RepID=A0ABS0VV76_9CORY|nr:hypothetical protein [Corynebacterium marambiense]MBI9000214.1 hypothetical protein [Corynebacterium marambiense]MCK7663568.1 hypothetical protein [Corynebacterium marambiense]
MSEHVRVLHRRERRLGRSPAKSTTAVFDLVTVCAQSACKYNNGESMSTYTVSIQHLRANIRTNEKCDDYRCPVGEVPDGPVIGYPITAVDGKALTSGAFLQMNAENPHEHHRNAAVRGLIEALDDSTRLTLTLAVDGPRNCPLRIDRRPREQPTPIEDDPVTDRPQIVLSGHAGTSRAGIRRVHPGTLN